MFELTFTITLLVITLGLTTWASGSNVSQLVEFTPFTMLMVSVLGFYMMPLPLAITAFAVAALYVYFQHYSLLVLLGVLVLFTAGFEALVGIALFMVVSSSIARMFFLEFIRP